MSDALRLTGVRAGYGETVVLEDIELALPERGALAVLGRNGVGKTTLLATIMGHTTFHAGSIEYQGKAIAGLPVYERCRLGVGLVPQTRDIFPSLTVEENLAVAARPGRWTLARVYGLDQTLPTAMNAELTRQKGLGWITQVQYDNVNLGYGEAGGWEFHHHHTHMSYNTP